MPLGAAAVVAVTVAAAIALVSGVVWVVGLVVVTVMVDRGRMAA